MKNKDEFDIHLIGLMAGIHMFEYKLTPSFFKQFDYCAWECCEVLVQIQLKNHETFFDIQLSGSGWVKVPCDLTGEYFDQEIHPKADLLVKYQDQLNQLDYRVWSIPYGEHTLNLSKFIFEVVVLSLPEKRIHPSIAYQDGQHIEFWTHQKSNRSKTTDPRWDKLNKLLKTTKEE